MSHEENLFWNFFHNNNNQPLENNKFLPPWIKDQTLPLLNEEGIKAVAAVLQAGVSFRQAINDAANEKRALKRQAQVIHEDKLKSFREKCEEALSKQMINENDGSYFRHQFVSNAKQYQHEVEQFREFVSTLESSLSSESVENQDSISSSSPTSSRINQARENFNFLCNQLGENWAKHYLKNNNHNDSEININKRNQRPPWQLNYSAENDPFAPPSSDESKVTFDGGKILDRFGRDVWEDRCYALGTTIQSGAAVGVGAKRFRSVSRKNCVRSELWDGWVKRILGSEKDESRDKLLQNSTSLLFSVQFNVCEKKNVHDGHQSLCTCTIVDPYLNDVFVECSNQRVMAFLDVCEKVDQQTNKNLQLQTAIVESFKEYKNFPLVGRLTSPKQNFGENSNNFHLTYEQVEHQCCLFLEFLSSYYQNNNNNEHKKLRCIAAIIDDSPEWLILDVACAVVGICFVGLHTCWPMEDLQRAIHEIVEPDLIIYHQRDYNEKILPAATKNSKHVDNNTNSKIATTLISFEEIKRAGVFVSTSLNNNNNNNKKSFTTSILQNEKQLSFFRDSLEHNHFDIFENAKNNNNGDEIQHSRPFTLMFSSGTSGQLKAVEVSCEAWLQTNFRQQRYQLDPYSVVSFNALAHGLDRGLCWTALFSAGRISFLPTNGDKTMRVDEMKKEIIQELVHSLEVENNSASKMKSAIPENSSLHVLLPDFMVGSHFCNPSVLVASPDLWTNLKNFISSLTTTINNSSTLTAKQAQETVRILFGNNIKQAATGGAPVAPAVVDFFQKIFSHVDVNSDVPLELKEKSKQKRKSEIQNQQDDDEKEECANFYDVYGATEAPGISTNHQIRAGLEIGLILESVTINDNHQQQNHGKRISFCEEGELIVRGSGVARKYHNDEESSKNSFLDDGWYRTGDVVRLEIENENVDDEDDIFVLKKYFQKMPFPSDMISVENIIDASSFFKLRNNATAKLFVVDRVRDFIELYVDHQSAWVPASKVETAILSKKDHIANELATNKKNLSTDDFFIIEQVAVFGDRMLPFLVAVVGIKGTNAIKNDEIRNMMNDKSKKQELEKELAETFKSLSLLQNDDDNSAIPRYWIPQKVMVHQVIDEDDQELNLDSTNNNNAMKLWKSGGEFRTHLGKLKRGVLGKVLRNQLAEYLC